MFACNRILFSKILGSHGEVTGTVVGERNFTNYVGKAWKKCFGKESRRANPGFFNGVGSYQSTTKLYLNEIKLKNWDLQF